MKDLKSENEEQQRLKNLQPSQHTLGTIDRLRSDVYAHLLKNPEFVKRVDELETTRPPKPNKA